MQAIQSGWQPKDASRPSTARGASKGIGGALPLHNLCFTLTGRILTGFYAYAKSVSLVLPSEAPVSRRPLFRSGQNTGGGGQMMIGSPMSSPFLDLTLRGNRGERRGTKMGKR